ncbi:hypothetical protein TNIN_212271 [Trichonephila inaurata madagascariensis]|uniref:Uncharacterized protein n=1 Tax=Trichonephila inaurata madagascariensis TaxID=2747483 RepID=A0A8X6X6C7_9ARAC|nr:hypothetical protein TNIN_212271 [Trichonephila inaurata madagascariensis]
MYFMEKPKACVHYEVHINNNIVSKMAQESSLAFQNPESPLTGPSIWRAASNSDPEISISPFPFPFGPGEEVEIITSPRGLASLLLCQKGGREAN